MFNIGVFIVCLMPSFLILLCIYCKFYINKHTSSIILSGYTIGKTLGCEIRSIEVLYGDNSGPFHKLFLIKCTKGFILTGQLSNVRRILAVENGYWVVFNEINETVKIKDPGSFLKNKADFISNHIKAPVGVFGILNPEVQIHGIPGPIGPFISAGSLSSFKEKLDKIIPEKETNKEHSENAYKELEKVKEEKIDKNIIYWTIMFIIFLFLGLALSISGGLWMKYIF